MTVATRHPATCECVRCCDNDAAREPGHERDEYRSALATYTETDHLLACRHSRRGDNGKCACGDVVDREEA